MKFESVSIHPQKKNCLLVLELVQTFVECSLCTFCVCSWLSQSSRTAFGRGVVIHCGFCAHHHFDRWDKNKLELQSQYLQLGRKRTGTILITCRAVVTLAVGAGVAAAVALYSYFAEEEPSQTVTSQRAHETDEDSEINTERFCPRSVMRISSNIVKRSEF